MIKTPILNFVKKYASSKPTRMHMPGHKGKRFLGCEELDITEISGADVLYGANGVIEESESIASEFFGTAHTFYSTEGSSLSIKSMLALAAYDAGKTAKNRRPHVLATRNVHKSFIYACALLDLEVDFLFSKDSLHHLCSCDITPKDVEKALSERKTLPFAVYVTSPDYLGNILDIKGISNVCHRFGVPLLVDNAHGAYLALTDPSTHPIALGADMCCDSAHKTLPSLTGAGYLHVSKQANPVFVRNARARLALFATTSPSYLILQSLDVCNKYLFEEAKQRFEKTVPYVDNLKFTLKEKGFSFVGNEPLKITMDFTENQVSGNLAADFLRLHYNIECEYSDENYLVLMVSPQNTPSEIDRLQTALMTVPLHPCENKLLYHTFRTKRACSIREAIFAPHASVRISQAVDRICASPTVSCPPAVPIAISGEIITEEIAELFHYYGIDEIDVLIQQN